MGPRPVWTDGKSRPRRDSIPDRPARSQSLYRLSYPTHHVSQYKILKIPAGIQTILGYILGDDEYLALFKCINIVCGYSTLRG